MQELFALVMLLIGLVFFFGPLIGVLAHGGRLRRLEAELERLRRTVATMQPRVESPPPRRDTLSTPLAQTLGTVRATRQVTPDVTAEDSIDLALPEDMGAVPTEHSEAERSEPDLAGKAGAGAEPSHEPDIAQEAAAVAGREASDSAEHEGDQRLIDAPLWSEFPPRKPKIAESQEDSDNATELLIVRVMTWAGVITLVLGVGFLYRYALAQGWISDTARVVGGLVVGTLGFGGAVLCRRKDYVFFGDCLAAASSGTIKLSIYAATVWYGMISAGTGFRGFLLGGAVLWAYAVFFRSRLAASLATVAALLTPALLPEYAGPTAAASTSVFAGYLFVVNLTVAAVSFVRAWRLPSALATLGTGIHLTVWYALVFRQGREAEALWWLAGFTLLFIGHALIAALKTDREHPLDAPVLIVGASFLYAAVIGVTLDADFVMRAWGPTLLAITYLGGWLLLRSRLPGRVGDVLGGVATFLVTAAIPLWLSPAWTLVPWAVLAVIWARIAIRDDRPISGAIAVGVFSVVQVLTAVLVLQTVGDKTQMPLPGWNWELSGSVGGQVAAMFKTVPVETTPLLGMLFHARSISLAACGLAALVALSFLKQRDTFERIRAKRADVRRFLGTTALVNLVSISLAEWTHAAIRGDWLISTSSAVWTLHFAMLTAFTAWWSRRDTGDAGRRSVTRIMLAITVVTALVAVLATIGEAINTRRTVTLLPILSLRSLVVLSSCIVVTVVARAMRQTATSSDTDEQSLIKQLSAAAVALGGIWITAETVQFGTWMELSAHEVSALLTGVLGVIGVGLLTAGFLKLDAGLRRAGLALLFVATLKIYLIDVWSATSEVRTVAFLVLGALLLAAALMYRRYRDQFRGWLTETNDVLR